jgi:hypothetical protein
MRCAIAIRPPAIFSKTGGGLGRPLVAFRPDSVSSQARVRPKGGGALEICREIRRQTAMHLARNLIGQGLTFPAFEGVERRPHDFHGRTLRRVAPALALKRRCPAPARKGQRARRGRSNSHQYRSRYRQHARPAAAALAQALLAGSNPRRCHEIVGVRPNGGRQRYSSLRFQIRGRPGNIGNQAIRARFSIDPFRHRYGVVDLSGFCIAATC